MKKNILLIGLLTFFLFSFSVYSLDINVVNEKFDLKDNLINNTIIENVSNVNNEFIKTKTDESINLQIKSINNDIDIDSYIYECLHNDLNLICKTQMQEDYIVWYDDLLRGRVEVSSYLKENDNYIFIFENVFYGKLHIGKHSDISFIGVEPTFYYFPTEEITGEVLDESESITYEQLNGTLLNGASVYTNITQSNANINLDGINDFVNISSSDSLNIKDDVTFMAWVKRDSINSYHTIISTGGYVLSGNAKTLLFLFLNDNRLQFEIETDEVIGVQKTNVITTQTFTDTTNYNHYVFVYDYSTPTAYFYYNGQLITAYDTDVEGDSNELQGDNNNFLGRHAYTNNLYLNGSISNAMWINKSLTDSEVEQIYNLTRKNYYIANNPVAEIIIPLNNSIVSNITQINYTCSDVDGNGNYSEIYIDGNLELNTTFNNINFSFDFSSFDSGSYNIELICVDDDVFTGNYIISVGITGDIIQPNITDLSSTNAVIILFVLAFLYIGLLAIGMIMQSLSVLIGAVVMGIFTGIQLGTQFSITLGFAFIFINVLFIITIWGNAKRD